MLEIFAPYMLFISFLLTTLFNFWLISKNTRWIVIIIANLLLIMIMEFLNLAEYNFLNVIVNWIFDFVGEIFGRFIDYIAGILREIWDSTVGALIEAIENFFDRIF